MKDLIIYPIAGLYNSDVFSLSTEPIIAKNCESLIRSNELFWSRLLGRELVSEAIDIMSDLYFDNEGEYKPYKYILENPERFITEVQESFKILTHFGIDPDEHLEARECISILCKLYSDFVFSPFLLVPETGFELELFSSGEILEKCMSPESNPYFNFVFDNIWPVVKEHKPELIWIYGRPDYSNMLIARFAKQFFPSVHISITNHSSEYYSLNKITDFLKLNKKLFTVIDSIILDDFDHSSELLSRCLSANEDLNNVPNIMFIDKSKSIIRTKYIPSKKTLPYKKLKNVKIFEPESKYENTIPLKQILDIKLFQDECCYWNKCLYCSINSKYKTQINEGFNDISDKVKFINHAVSLGYRFFIFNDEALPPEILEELADKIISEDIKTFWFVRSRIDDGFNDQLCKKLYRAGLRSIYFGLESASSRVQKLMNKYDNEFDINKAEDIIDMFTRNGIQSHFCTIIGFPGETELERKETFSFLEYLKDKSEKFTFTINIFELFVGSPLFERSEKYGIELKLPCHPEDYIGNIALYFNSVDYNNLLAEKNKFLLKIISKKFNRQIYTSIHTYGETSNINNVIRNSLISKK